MNPGGFGQFGSPSGFNSTSTNLFSSSTQNTNQNMLKPGGLFGSSTTPTTSTLGSTQPTNSLFGNTSFGFSSATNTTAVGAVAQTGTIHPKFSAPSGQDTVSKNNQQQTINTNHQCITAMKEYEGKSLEELRLEDYQANRKFAQSQSQFGTNSLFSGSNNTNTGFSQPGLFGTSTTQNKPSLFGGTPAATTTTPTTTSLFGSNTNANQANRSFFGAQPAATTTTSPFSFGSTQPATTNAFGTTTTTQPSIFGGLSGTSTTTTSGGLFGSTTPATTTGTTGGLFGSSSTQANKPVFSGFGQTAQTTTTPSFSFGNTGASTTTTTPSIFGSTTTTTQSPLSASKPFGSTTLGGFGSTTTGGFGSTSTTTPSTSIFGNTASSAPKTGFGATTTGFGGFGSTNSTTTPSTGGLFSGFSGSTTQPATTTTASPFGSSLTSGGLGTTGGFGSTNTTTTGGLFGNNTATQPASTGGFFSSPQSSGFGTTQTSGFGSTTTSQPSLLSSGFGSTTGSTGTTGGLFGSTNQQQTSAFGGLGGLGGTSANTTGLGSGFNLTGGSSTGTGTGLFGSTTGAGTTTGFGGANTSSGLFGPGLTGSGGLNTTQTSTLQQQQLQLQQQQQQQQQLQSQNPLVQQQLLALSNSPYGTSSLLKSTLQDLNKNEDIFKPVSPLAQRQYITEVTSPSKAPSIIPSSTSTDFKGGLSQPVKLAPKALSTISLNKQKTDLFEGLEDEETPCFYPRKNIKKLLFKPQVETNTSRRSSASSSVNGDQKPDFLRKSFPVPDETIRYNGATVGANGTHLYPNLAHITNDVSGNVSEDGGNGDNQSEISNQNQPPSTHPANITLERPGYFTIPSMQDLANMTDSKGDCFAENLAIGRVDYGCITFPGITNVANMNLDEIVHIRRKEVHVYPDETKKTPVGQGLNKPAEITLHRIWPTDKITKAPITDPDRIISMGYNKKIEKATIDMDAQFIDYDPLTGSWTFKVKHFSKYGLHDSEDEDDDQVITNNLNNLNKGGLIKPPINTLSAMNALDREPQQKYDSDTDSVKHEKDMIQRQLKLIEARRLELLQQRKGSIGIGSNLNSISNQQWEMLNEYTMASANKPKSKFIDSSNLRLELSSDDEQEEDENDEVDNIGEIDEEDEDDTDDRNSMDSHRYKPQTIRMAILQDNDDLNETDDTTDDNKENKDGLFPNLNNLKGKKKKSKNLKKIDKQKTIKSDKIYPNLNNITESYSIQQQRKINYDIDNKDNLRLTDEMATEEQQQMDDLPFMATTGHFGLGSRGNKRMVDAFFNNDEKENNEFLNMDDDDMAPGKLGGFKGGLLKRGLGGVQNPISEHKLADLSNSVVAAAPGALGSLKTDPFFGKSKVSKLSASTANLAALSINDAQTKIGSRILKPKLWNRLLITQKQTRQILAGNFIDEQDDKQLSAAALYERKLQSISMAPASSSQTESLSLIKLSESVSNGLNWCVVDAGLFNSRRFRITWSMHPTAQTYTRLSSSTKSSTFINSIQLVTPVLINTGNMALSNYDLTSSKFNTVKENCEKYLNVQLKLTEFVDQVQVPYLRTKSGNELIRECCECTQNIRNNIGDHPDADNVEHMKSVWNLCQNLWGDISDSLKSSQFETINGANQYEQEQIRKRLLSEWLADVSSHRIDRESKFIKYNKNKDNYLNSIFSLLTGNRVLDACNISVDNLDFRLAMLLSQSSGSNDTVRRMIKTQLNEWFSSNSDKYVSLERLKLYVLVAGDLTYNVSKSQYNNSGTKPQFINVCENLDWKRQFAIHLWYHCLPINSINDALSEYEKSISEQICDRPVPPYVEDSVSTSIEPPKMLNNTMNFGGNSFMRNDNRNQPLHSVTANQERNELYDTCYHLIKLYCNSNHPVEDIISPLNHTSNQLDFRLSWHLAMALVSLQYNHVSKFCLENLHDSYAMQLQSIGLWHWAIFVIMHIEDEKRREKYVRQYLSKNVTSNSDLNDQETFLIEKLKIPSAWVYEYKALRAKYEGLHENQLKLLLKAHKWNEAHLLLMEILAPDLFIKQNYKTLNEYLQTLSKESNSIMKWNLGGQVYLDFIRLNQKAQILFNFSEEDLTQKNLNEDILRQIEDELFNLSTRLKEFDNKTPKKLLCSIIIAKLLLKIFNVFIELRSNDQDNQMNEEEEQEEDEEQTNSEKVLTKSIVERAYQLTDSVPDHNIICTMQLKKSKYTHDYLMSKRRY